MALTKIGTEGITGVSNSSDATAITIDSSERVGIGTTTPDTLLVLSKTDSGTTVNKDITSTNGPVLTIHNPDQTDNNLSSIQFTSRGTSNAAEMASAGIHVVHEDQGGTYSIGSMGLYTTNSAGTYQNNLNIDSNGHIVMARQPAFLVTPSGTQSNIPINGLTQIAFATEVYDQNGDFASNTFTAPVTGKYLLSIHLYTIQNDSATSHFGMRLITSNRFYESIFDPDTNDGDNAFSHTYSVIADMDANDTASVSLNVDNTGSAQTDISVSSFFSGALIC